jgi:hypothetical protein
VCTYYVRMNITLSADGALLDKARKYASSRNTTVNQLIREYLTRLVGETSSEEAAAEFEAVALTMGGRSPDGWRLDRGTIHRHDGDA